MPLQPEAQKRKSRGLAAPALRNTFTLHDDTEFNDLPLEIQARWLARRADLSVSRARLIAGLWLDVEHRRAA